MATNRYHGVHYSYPNQPPLSLGAGTMTVVNWWAPRRFASRCQQIRAQDGELIMYTLPTSDYDFSSAEPEIGLFYTGTYGSAGAHPSPSNWYWNPANRTTHQIPNYNGYLMDMRVNSAWVNHLLTNFYPAMMDNTHYVWGLDGFFLDTVGDGYLGFITGLSAAEQTEYSNGVKDFVRRLRLLVGENCIIVNNNGWAGDNNDTDGIMVEGHFESEVGSTFWLAKLANVKRTVRRRNNTLNHTGANPTQTEIDRFKALACSWAQVTGVDGVGYSVANYENVPTLPFGTCNIGANGWPAGSGHLHLWDSATDTSGGGGGTTLPNPPDLTGVGYLGSRLSGPNGSTMTADFIRGTKFTLAAASVQFASVIALVDGLGGTAGTQTIRVAIYNVSGGELTTLVASSNTITITANDAAAWRTLTFPSTVILTAGDYAICIHSGGSSGVARYFWDSVPGIQRLSADTFADGSANPFSVTPTTGEARISIYADYSNTGVGPLPAVSLSEINIAGAGTGTVILLPDKNRTRTRVIRRTGPPESDAVGANPAGTTVYDNSSGTVVGNTAIGTMTTLAADTKHTIQVTFAGQTVDFIYVWLDGLGTSTPGLSAKFKAVIYADSAGSPGALTKTGTEVIVPVGQVASLIALPVTSPAALTGTYHIGFIVGGDNNVARYSQIAATPNERTGTDTYTDGASDPAGTTTLGSVSATIMFLTGYPGGGPSGGTVTFTDTLTAGSYYYDVYTEGPNGTARVSAFTYPRIIVDVTPVFFLSEDFANDTVGGTPSNWTPLRYEADLVKNQVQVVINTQLGKALEITSQAVTNGVAGYAFATLNKALNLQDPEPRAFHFKFGNTGSGFSQVYMTGFANTTDIDGDTAWFSTKYDGATVTFRRRGTVGGIVTITTVAATGIIDLWYEIDATNIRVRLNDVDVDLGSGAGVSIAHEFDYNIAYLHFDSRTTSDTLTNVGTLYLLDGLRSTPKDPVTPTANPTANGVLYSMSAPDAEDKIIQYKFKIEELDQIIVGTSLPVGGTKPQPGTYTIKASVVNESPF